MPKERFAIESDGENQLEINWKGGYFNPEKDINVVLDGSVIHTIPTRDELHEGREIVLPDSSTLLVRWVDGKLQVLRSGQSLRDLLHPKRRRKSQYWFFTFWGLGNIFVGSLATSKLVWGDTPIQEIVGYFVFGLLFLGLSFLTKKGWRYATISGDVLLITQLIFLSFGENQMNINLLIAIIFMVVVVIKDLQSIQKMQPS